MSCMCFLVCVFRCLVSVWMVGVEDVELMRIRRFLVLVSRLFGLLRSFLSCGRLGSMDSSMFILEVSLCGVFV